MGCPHCQLPFHDECWREVGGCGTYGCQAAPDVPKTETAPSDEFVPGWVADKTCPACGSQIMATALVCKVCKAAFPTDRPMSTTEWAEREYDGDDAINKRNMVIANFVFSALGCLFFFTIPINVYILSGNEPAPFRIKRLAPTLRVVYYASLGISCLWGVMAVFLFLVR